ncbi:hypothetical protein Syun_017331 [Stephania yunnanensis]|uniref:Uncharacterized protein n=1 Tax=Stephania yunnanensis TaxID=152371 RepID=A0AAP0J6Q7_9MAGN
MHKHGYDLYSAGYMVARADAKKICLVLNDEQMKFPERPQNEDNEDDEENVEFRERDVATSDWGVGECYKTINMKDV